MHYNIDWNATYTEYIKHTSNQRPKVTNTLKPDKTISRKTKCLAIKTTYSVYQQLCDWCSFYRNMNSWSGYIFKFPQLNACVPWMKRFHQLFKSSKSTYLLPVLTYIMNEVPKATQYQGYILSILNFVLTSI